MSVEDRALRERAARWIPNGMYGHMSTGLMPPGIPQFYSKAEGTRLWDADGRSYIDCLAAYGPNLLGYNDARVQAAIRAQMALVDTSSGPSHLMVDLAEMLVGMIGYADWAMFCKNGSDATGMAVMMARHHTGRRKILVGRSTYHGAQNWSTPSPAGVLPSDREHLIYFDVTDPDSFQDALTAATGDLAGIIMTPHRHEIFEDQGDPRPQLAHAARAACDAQDAVLILDEIRTGFRLGTGSSWDDLGISPDIGCWGKVLGNGQPISAVVGSERLRAAAGGIYVTGSFWYSAVPMAAAMETLRQVQKGDYLRRMNNAGQMFRDGLNQRAAAHGLTLRQSGPLTMPLVLFEEDPDFRRIYRFVQLCAQNGVLLSPYHNLFMNAAMTPEDIAALLDAAEIAFADIQRNGNDLPDLPPHIASFIAMVTGGDRQHGGH